MLKPIIHPIHRIHYLHRQGVIGWILRHPKNLRIVEMDVRDIHWISIPAERLGHPAARRKPEFNKVAYRRRMSRLVLLLRFSGHGRCL